MTDKAKFQALMAEFGVLLKSSIYNGNETLSIEDNNDCPKVKGYAGFTADFKFDAVTGAFIEVGIYE